MIKQLGLESSGKASGSPYTEAFKCKKCQDAGILHPLKEDGSVDYSKTIVCECREEEIRKIRILQLMRMCELPAGKDNCTFENFKVRQGTETAFKLAKRLASGDEKLKWLTFLGDVDVGKTHLAIAICRHWLLRGEPAKYAYVPLLLEELRRGYNHEGEESFEYRFKIYLTIPLLVLDDLGAENLTEWAQEKLDTIVSHRDNEGLPLVVTSNLALDEMPQRIASRLRRQTFGDVVFIDASEYSIYLRGKNGDRL